SPAARDRAGAGPPRVPRPPPRADPFDRERRTLARRVAAIVIDTHCHLTHRRFDQDADRVIERAREAGLEACLTIGTGSQDARRCRSLADRWPGFVYCSAGIDPFSAHRSGEGFSKELDELRELLDEGTFHALGEIGLDYHYDLDPPALQAERFEA